MKVVITARAAADLEHIADHIAKDSPVRALSFVAELEAACLELGDAPEAYPVVPRYRDVGIRRRIHGNYLIFFRSSADAVEVLRLLHGAMNYEAVLPL